MAIFLICMAVVMASVIGGVYYVRIVQILYFTNYFLLTWQKVLNRLDVIKFRKSIPLKGCYFYYSVFNGVTQLNVTDGP